MSGFFQNTIDAFKVLPLALKLAPLWMVLVFLGEGLQHYVEIQMGMFDNPEAFKARQGDHIRLAFGILKAILVVLTAFCIPLALNKHFQYFAPKNLIKKLVLYRPDRSFGYLISLLVLCGPLMWIHFKLNELAMTNAFKNTILTLDSAVVALIGLALGVTFWAGLAKPHLSNETPAHAPS